jgi:uncharacterized membrane-anchored protein YhcB (DUF1043 family)
MKFSGRDVWLIICGCSLGLVLAMLVQRVVAYDSGVDADLQYSRNALLKQRSELATACDNKAAQIAQLQLDIDRLHTYMKDTDRALGSIEIAIRGK